MRPDARRERLLMEAIGDELVVYDLQRHRVHQLNHTAALIWQSCDGHKTVAELTKGLHDQLSPAVSEVVVWHALDRLGKAGLLRESVTRPEGGPRMTRRQALQKLGRTAALAFLIPAVTSVSVPTPVQANEREEDCDDNPCNRLCKDQCKKDKDCPKSTPLCRLLACSASGTGSTRCRRCLQRRCTKNVTAHVVGGGGD